MARKRCISLVIALVLTIQGLVSKGTALGQRKPVPEAEAAAAASAEAKAKARTQKLRARVVEANQAFQRGVGLYSKQNAEAAIKEWRRALDLYPRHESGT